MPGCVARPTVRVSATTRLVASVWAIRLDPIPVVAAQTHSSQCSPRQPGSSLSAQRRTQTCTCVCLCVGVGVGVVGVGVCARVRAWRW